ncbi:MAG: hypothetical protein EBS37_17250 [Betaproteobacteria bacterium]|nr:hypothetical protein [Betaproteobacteria bacterium]
MADHPLGHSLLAGQQGGHAGRPGQTTGQHRQRVAHVDHLVQARAEIVWCRHGQIPQKSLPPVTIPEGSGVPLSVKNRGFMRVAAVSQGRLCTAYPVCPISNPVHSTTLPFPRGDLFLDEARCLAQLA